ncbi:MAG: hypothetical protein HYX25_10840 [Candidatus Solibacter usitatus]|nr:hypothetical protein [Candidatus Solibacter usitatus]
MHGYHGKILHVDLTARRAWIEEPGEIFWRVYAGGGLLAAYFLMRDTQAGIDAFDPRNLLILTSSVLAGHPYAGLARFTAASKSPLTGGIGETRAEGPFGMALKGSGADTLIFHGAFVAPCHVMVEAGAVTFHDAAAEWGLGVERTVDNLESRFGNQIHTAVIGPAGENRVLYASIISDRSYAAARMGMGAVMGSKQLKSVILRGDNRPPVADAAACAELTAQYEAKMRGNPLTRWQLDPPGFSAWVHLHGTDAALCTRNYTQGVFEGESAYEKSRFLPHYLHDGNCPGCPNGCIKFFDDPRSGGIHQEITGALGPNLGIASPEFIFQANILCNDFGLDPTSLGFTLSMAMEAGALSFGDTEAVLRLIPEIAHRRGPGNVLADGAKRAALQLGGPALHVKGLEMVPFEPRTQTNLALGYAVAPIGPRYDICEHDWDYDTQGGWEHTLENSRAAGILERIPMDFLGPRKVRNFKALATLWSGADALDFCIFAIAPVRVFSLSDMARMLAAVTGWNTTAYEIMRYGERRLHLMRMYNLREGFTAADDTLPDRFFDDPLDMPGSRWHGKRLDRAAFAHAIVTYYRMMGWDDAGRPLPETLIDYQLEWTFND